MKLLLTEDIPNIGNTGDLVDVSAGFARNYLLPTSRAIAPTKANLKRVEKLRAEAEARRARLRAEAEEMAKRVDGQEVTIAATCNEQGHLFGSVGPRQIADAMAEAGMPINPDQVSMHEHIKELDKRDVQVTFGYDVKATISVWVVSDRPQDMETEQDVTEDAGSDEQVYQADEYAEDYQPPSFDEVD